MDIVELCSVHLVVEFDSETRQFRFSLCQTNERSLVDD